jgi:predicted nucleic acid-binding protein
VRAVVDTNVVASAFRSKSGASFRLIDEFFALPARWQWSASSACIFEYEEVLVRQFHHRELVDAFLNDLVAKADKITRVECVRPLLPDPDDEMFAELILAAEADWLVTFNKADFLPLPSLGVLLATPAEFLKILEHQR